MAGTIIGRHILSSMSQNFVIFLPTEVAHFLTIGILDNVGIFEGIPLRLLISGESAASDTSGHTITMVGIFNEIISRLHFLG